MTLATLSDRAESQGRTKLWRKRIEQLLPVKAILLGFRLPAVSLQRQLIAVRQLRHRAIPKPYRPAGS
jgi:hypothetical protein